VLSNPLNKATPLVELGELARKHHLLLIVDNTFLTPISVKPAEHGAHITLHSGTKYLNGHSDLTCGVAAGSRKYVDRIWGQMLKYGGKLDPLACFLLERGLKTLPLRMRAHRENADAIAAYLLEHPKILAVHHPSTPDYAYPWLHDYCDQVACGMVTFVVEGGDEASVRLLDHLKLPKVAPSLGGIESLISLPFNTSQSSLTESQRTKAGIDPGMVRFSVGCEDTKDLIADFEQALDRL
jgi:cystathionine beta-lyase/cystathionine gamma-synthase